jgi:Na+/melibiose symporter-like transporter
MFVIYLLNLLGGDNGPSCFTWFFLVVGTNWIVLFTKLLLLCLTNMEIHISKKSSEKPTRVVRDFGGPNGS